MRVLIVLLLLLGITAAVFYETKGERTAQQRIEPASPVQHAYGTDDADTGPTKTDESGRFGLNEPGTSDPMAEGDAPSFEPPAPRRQVDGERPRRADLSQGGSPRKADEAQQAGRFQALRQSLAIALLLKRGEDRKTSDDLAAVRQELHTAVKERGELSARASALGSDAAKLQAALQAKGDEAADARRQLADQAGKNASAGAAQSTLASEMTTLKGKAEEAGARQQEAEGQFARSRALVESLQTKLAQLDATSRQALSRAKEELTHKDEAAGRQGASLAEASQKLASAEAKVRDLSARQGAATLRIARLTAQQRLAATGLWAARQVLASTRASAQQRLAALQSDRARQVAEGNDALRKRSQDADSMKGALSKASGDAAALRKQLKTLGSQRESAAAELSGARAENAMLEARLAATAADSGKKVATLVQRDASLADQAAHLAQLLRDRDEGRRQMGALEKRVADLNSTNAEQAARIDALNGTAKDELAERNALTGRLGSSAAEASKKLALAEAKVRDLSADRDAATSRIARATAQQRLTATSLAAIRVALANERAGAQQQASGRRVADDDAARTRLEDARRQTDAMQGALSRATDTAAAAEARLRSLQSRRDSAESELARARAENATLSARLDAATTGSEKKLADLRLRNASLVDQAARLPQLTHDLDEGRKQVGSLEQMLAALKSQNKEQIAQVHALKSAGKGNAQRLAQAETDRQARTSADGERAQKLEGALASVRAELAQVIKDKNATIDARRSSERALAAVNAKLHAERSQAVLPGRAKAEPHAAAPTRLTRDDRPSDDRPVAEARNLPFEAKATSSVAALPDSAAAHVLLRYAPDKARSQARAKTLQAALRTLGVEVKESAAAVVGKPGNSVTYFYAEDQSIADRVAQQIAAPAPTRSRNAGLQAPRPGTIEVMIGG